MEREREKKTTLVEQRADYERMLKELQLRLATNQKALLNIEQKSKDIIVLEQMGVGESTVKYGKWKHFRERKDHAGNLCSDGVL